MTEHAREKELLASSGAGSGTPSEAKTNEIQHLRQRLDWLEGTAMPHARKQENANGFQKGWHAALSRVSEGDTTEALSMLVPQPSADVDDTLPWPLHMPVWKCKSCGCLWRDNLDDTVSLLNAEQKSCASCEMSTTKEACAIHWLSNELVGRRHRPKAPADPAQGSGSATEECQCVFHQSQRERTRLIAERDEALDLAAVLAMEAEHHVECRMVQTSKILALESQLTARRQGLTQFCEQRKVDAYARLDHLSPQSQPDDYERGRSVGRAQAFSELLDRLIPPLPTEKG